MHFRALIASAALLVCSYASSVHFKYVDFFGQLTAVPFNQFPELNKNITTLFITEFDKLKFLLNTALSMMQHSNATAFSVLCMDCSVEQSKLWTSKGLHVIESKTLLEMSNFAFRLDGPMPHNAVLPDRDMRRHSRHMMYREWIKLIMLENGLSVFLVDIDICFHTAPPFFSFTEDIIMEGVWPTDFRPNSYSFHFIENDPETLFVLNNGVALFTPTEAFMRFERECMGVLAHEIVASFGFAQTAFAMLMNLTNLSLDGESTTAGTLTGSNEYGVSVRAVQMMDFCVHPAGFSEWSEKERIMRQYKAWILPDNWMYAWNTTGNIADMLMLHSYEQVL